MADFTARNVRIQFPCRHVTLLNCGEGDTFIPVDVTRQPGGVFTDCGRISPVVDIGCGRSRHDLEIPANCGMSSTKIPLPLDPAEIYIRPEELTVLKQLLAGRMKDIEQQITEIDQIESQVKELGNG